MIQVGDARFEPDGPGVCVCVRADVWDVTLLWLLAGRQTGPRDGELESMSRGWAAALTREDPWEDP